MCDLQGKNETRSLMKHHFRGEYHLAESLLNRLFSLWIFFLFFCQQHLFKKLRSLLFKWTQISVLYRGHRGLCCALLFGGYALLELWSMALSQWRTPSVFFSRCNGRWAFGHVTPGFSFPFCCTSSVLKKIFGPRLQYDSVWGQCKSLGFLHLLNPSQPIQSFSHHTQLLGLNR